MHKPIGIMATNYAHNEIKVEYNNEVIIITAIRNLNAFSFELKL